MKIEDFEKLMKNEIEYVFDDFLSKYDYIIPVSARARGGAQISDFLEDGFVDYITKNSHNHIYNPLGAPKGATKNPYDFCFNYKVNECNFDDLIWGDIKATKHSYIDSNPDLGTPEKIIKFINQGHFYLLFVFFEYEEAENDKTKFIKFTDGKYVHCQFLKDIHHSVRINPKPQFQVNIHENEEYRTIDDFVDLFQKKYNESIDRIIEKQTKKKLEMNKRFDNIKSDINNYKNKWGFD